jgi:L-asparaginase
MGDVDVLGRIGPNGPGLFVLYTGGTIGMGPGPDGALVPLDLRELGVHLPFVHRLPIGLTVATLTQPIDSSAMETSDWITIADAIVDHAPGHAGVVVLHGTDTIAYTASALSFLLEGTDIPIVLTGAQRPVTELRSDGRENLVTALAIAAGHLHGAPLVPEVTIFFDDVLLRGNRTVKVHADSYSGFASPNYPPLATTGVTIDIDTTILPPGTGPIRRSGSISDAVTALRLHPGLVEHTMRAELDQPGPPGVVLEAYGAGSGSLPGRGDPALDQRASAPQPAPPSHRGAEATPGTSLASVEAETDQIGEAHLGMREDASRCLHTRRACSSKVAGIVTPSFSKPLRPLT